ncbi:MAG: hypothetical protein VXV96_08820 [Bdellovibrionota bacterium]|nr:hypothetical protein [Bdellovibrionota bacterium]
MKKKKRYTNRDIFKVKIHIQRIFPHANKVDVKIDKLPSGEFKSFIRVLAPQKKELIAQKRDEDIKKCLEKSQHAIIRQIHRIKTKWDRTSSRVPELAMSA